MKTRCFKGQRIEAFSLVELMVGMTIFSMVAASGFATLNLGFGLMDTARSYTQASQIMQSEVERVRSLAWASLNNLPTQRSEVPLASEFDSGAFKKYTLYRSILGAGDTRKITVEIEWRGINGRTYTKSYATQYTRGGLHDYIQ